MKRNLFLRLLSALFVFVFLVAGTGTALVAAQSAVPSSGGPDEGGAGSVPQTAQAMDFVAGTDAFGYNYATGTFGWVDATGGTNAGLTDAGAKSTGAISLGFSFPFYEKNYTSAYISAYGYLTFTGGQPNVSDPQFSFPYSAAPNDMIAAFWGPFTLSNGGTAGQVFYARPDANTFVVQWNQVSDSGNTYTFEIVLNSNGNILVQHEAMGPIAHCHVAGMEDSRGLDGFTFIPTCTPYTSNAAYSITRPANAARVFFTPRRVGKLAHAGEVVPYTINIYNTGSTADTFNFTGVSSPWLYALSATNTGVLQVGGTYALTVNVTTPGGAAAGASNRLTLSVVSAANPSVSRSLTLETAVPAPFVTGFMTRNNYAQNLLYAAPGGSSSLQESADGIAGFNSAVAELRSGNIVYAWEQNTKISYGIFSRTGGVVRSAAALTPGTASVVESSPSVAALPNGKFAIAFMRQVFTGNNFTSNAVLQILNADGSKQGGEILVTNSSATGTDSVHPHRVYEVEASSTLNNHFVVAWAQSNINAPSSLDTLNVHMAVYNHDGTMLMADKSMTTDGPGSEDGFRMPGLAPLTDNRILFAYSGFTGSATNPQSVFVRILDSNGGDIGGTTPLQTFNTPAIDNRPDPAQMSNGNILIAWGGTGDTPSTGGTSTANNSVYYAVLNSTGTSIVRGPAPLSNTASYYNSFASVTADDNGHGIITWSDAHENPGTGGSYIAYNIFYAAVDGTGNILTPAMQLVNNQVGIQNGYYGHSTTSHYQVPPVTQNFPMYLPMIAR